MNYLKSENITQRTHFDNIESRLAAMIHDSCLE